MQTLRVYALVSSFLQRLSIVTTPITVSVSDPPEEMRKNCPPLPQFSAMKGVSDFLGNGGQQLTPHTNLLLTPPAASRYRLLCQADKRAISLQQARERHRGGEGKREVGGKGVGERAWQSRGLCCTHVAVSYHSRAPQQLTTCRRRLLATGLDQCVPALLLMEVPSAAAYCASCNEVDGGAGRGQARPRFTRHHAAQHY